ncbi:MAG: hypothetical protein ACK4VI_06340 [Alphaproteobacteria bacterium]
MNTDIFSQLSDDIRHQIIALPYKAGMLISHADDVEGEDDDFSEMKALEKAFPEVAKLHPDSALVQAVSLAIIDSPSFWPQWENECFFVVRQAPDIMQQVIQNFGVDEAREYRAYIMEIGKLVARAHGEFEAFDDMAAGQEKESFFAGIIGRLTQSMAQSQETEGGHPANISASEKAALKELSDALRVDG